MISLKNNMNQNSNALIGLVVLLTIIVAVLAYVLFTTPAPGEGDGTVATTTENGGEPEPTVVRTGAFSDKVVVSSPLPGATVGSTFTVKGAAPGNWYFEASFPIEVRDPSGTLLAQLPAQAEGEWMTTEQVSFSVDISTQDYTGPATLVLHRDNPSGLPENDSSVEIPIIIR